MGRRLPALMCGKDHRQVEERHLHLLAEQIVDGGRSPRYGM